MTSAFTKSMCLLALVGAAQVASAQMTQTNGAGAAGQSPYGAGAAGQPTAGQNSYAAGAAGTTPNADGNVYSAPNAPKPLPPLVDQATINYDAAVNTMSPLTGDQIKALRKRIDQAKRAAATSARTPSKPVSSSVTVDLSPGAPPPIVRVSHLGATVNFIDSTGAPWDIIEVNNMAKGRFDVLKPVPSIPSITITANGDYVEGDVAVFLKELPFPIVVKMIAGQKETDYRLDVRIPRRGPNAVAPVRGTAAIDLPKDYMQSLLDGVDTPGAKPIRIENASSDMKAWAVGDRIVLRTSLSLHNPAYYGILTAADGTHVYEIPQTPVVTVSANGATRNIILDLE
ncbi:DotH/IcmK family type IV secretion protein [Burkholderia stagnalis]|uniref:DotH/IcmK family type IV secretion protein n=1 Tax=Burkholderia stagnalis TaxID=1503054 RepID=UPI0009BF55F4|nr:DotH/IcmK family type IV secretion protein [Burkholderia stagnalis]